MTRPTIEQMRDPKWQRDLCDHMLVSKDTWKWLDAGYPSGDVFWLAKYPVDPVPPGQVEIAMSTGQFNLLRRGQLPGESDNDTIRRVISAFI